MITLSNIDPQMIANNLDPSTLYHPGELLAEELEERGLTQTSLAQQLGISVSIVNEIIKGKRNISVEFAMMLEAALGIEASLWINLQREYDLESAKANPTFVDRLAKIRRMAAVLYQV